MSEPGTITLWLNQLQKGEREGVQDLWESYFQKLVQMARAHLRGVPQIHADSEQVAVDAFNSFCLGAEQKRFPKLEDRDDLWQILVMLTRNKALNLRERETREKRDYRRVVGQADFSDEAISEEGSIFYNLIQSGEPDPQFAAELAEQFQVLLDALPDDNLREIAILKLNSHTNNEIAEKIERSVSTVELRLKRIRMIWANLLESGE